MLLHAMYSQDVIRGTTLDPRAGNADRDDTEEIRKSVSAGRSTFVFDPAGAASRLFVPITKPQAGDRPNLVTAVVEARGKDGGFDCDDEYILRTVGTVALETLRVCEEQDEMDWEEKRSELVLQFAQELMPASTPQGLDPDAPDVLEVLRRALQLIFSADEATTVHLVYPNAFRRVYVWSKDGMSDHVEPIGGGYGGLLLEALKSKKPISVDSKDPGTKYHEEIDIDLSEFHGKAARKAHLHTVPAFSGQRTVSAVLQFRCPDPMGRPFGDDGCFNPYSVHHIKLLQQLLVYVMLHVNKR